MKKILFIVASIIIFSFLSLGQPNKSVVKIKTSAICSQCKTRIEKALIKTDGIKMAYLNLTDSLATVYFNSKKITVDEIRTTISNLGYDADTIKRNAVSYEQLPNCCKTKIH
jgi:copper chaperone CopZ